MKIGCTFYFVLVCGIAALVSQLVGIFIPKVMVFEADHIEYVNISNNAANTNLAERADIKVLRKIIYKHEPFSSINNQTLSDGNEMEFDSNKVETVTKRQLGNENTSKIAFKNSTELDSVFHSVQIIDWNDTAVNEFQNASSESYNEVNKTTQNNCEDRSSIDDSSESLDSSSEEIEEREKGWTETNDYNDNYDHENKKTTLKEDGRHAEDDENTRVKVSRCEESSSSSEEDDDDESESIDEDTAKTDPNQHDIISIGLWSSHVCIRDEKNQQICNTYSITEAIFIVENYVGYSKNDIDESLWTNIRTESALAVLCCIIALATLILSARGYFHRKQLAPLVLSIVGYIASGVLALVPVTRVMIVTVDLLSSAKQQHRTLTLSIPWSVLTFGAGALFSMIASFTLISVTWYGRKQKWRLLLKRTKHFDHEIAIRLHPDNVAKLYAAEDGELVADVYVESAEKADQESKADCQVFLECRHKQAQGRKQKGDFVGAEVEKLVDKP